MTGTSLPKLSPSFVPWMVRHQASIVCTSYQAGRPICIGSLLNGAPAYSSAKFAGAMGAATFSQRLYLVTGAAIWRLENVLKTGELVDDALTHQQAEPWCGILIVETRTGDIVQWARPGSEIVEMFDVALMASSRAVAVTAPNGDDEGLIVTIEQPDDGVALFGA